MADIFSSYPGDDTSTVDAVPSYLAGADLHNIGNSQKSWFDPSTWGDRVENGFKFGAASIVSGAAQLYNGGVTITNWFGNDSETADIQKVMTNLDSNLGEYYSQNQQGVDLVGFIASSFIPGLGGMKVLNAGQHMLEAGLASGKIGGNLARATGLLVPKTEAYISAAAQQINASSVAMGMINQNSIKALASGAWQQTLEAAAFETMVQATMSSSPILANQDTGDIVKNIVVGGALGGVIGGAFEAASIYSKLKKAVIGFEKETKFATSRTLQQELNRPDINVIRNVQDLESAANAFKPTGRETPEELELLKTTASQQTQRDIRINNAIRSNMNELAKGSDLSATNMVTDAITGMSSDDVMAGILHADQIVRPGIITTVEQEIKEAVKKNIPIDPSLQVNYIKLTGEGSGLVSDSSPTLLNIADKASLARGVTVKQAVLDTVRDYGFKPKTLWDAGTKVGVKDSTEAEARYIWAANLDKLPDELSVHMNDIPLLERAFDDGRLNVKLVDDTGAIHKDGFASRDELWKYLVETKEDVANKLLITRAFKKGEDDLIEAAHIGKIVNTKVSRLDGSLVKDDLGDYRAWQTSNEEYKAFLQKKGLSVPDDADVRYVPSYAKVARRIPESMMDVDGNLINGATWIKTQEKLAMEAVNNVVAKATGNLYSFIPEITEQQAWTANRVGAGAKTASFASGGYGSLESIVQSCGSVSQQLKAGFRKDTGEVLTSPLVALGQKQEAAIEFATVNQKVTRSAKQWVRHTEDDGTQHLITKDAQKSMMDEKNPISFAEIPEDQKIAFVNQETIDAVDAMIGLSGKRTSTYAELRAAQGMTDAKDPAVFRPIRPNPKDYPHFAFVKDDKVTGQGHTTMLFAADAKKLQQLGDSAEQSGFRVLYKSDPEEFAKARGDYEYQRTLNESYIDSTLKNKGIYSEFYTKTDPQGIVDSILQQHLREDDVLAMELMRAKNQKIFDYLEDQGKAYARIESSKFGGTIARAEANDKNPYISYIRTALDIPNTSGTLWAGFNKFLDESVSKAVSGIKDSLGGISKAYDAEKINGLLDKYGINTGYRDAALDLLVNHSAPRNELTKFVRSANGLLSTLTLGLDPLNSLVNAIGANVLRGTELNQLAKAINSGNQELAGKLAQIAKIDVTGHGDLVISPLKLYAQAQKNFFDDFKSDLLLTKRYTDAGYIKGDSINIFHSMMDDIALKGDESVSLLQSKLNSAFQKAKDLGEFGRKITGNNFSENYNRFVSADVMRQLTDLAEGAGILAREESHSYINTFVNRVDGITVASQRPMMFQGPLGQAIGLFQSYQFNMMQNLFRYAAEGSKKDVAMLMGLQSTFFGLNGLPAFQFINTHVVGTASGNKNHVDMYDATCGAVGKQVGDLLMYGLPSNLLRTNLYSRGDINPRQLTVVPTQIKDIPFVNAYTNFMGQVKETLTKVGDGANVWSSFLQGLEHNGLSRPLAGMAQVMEATGPSGKVYSTTSKGSILFSNDLLSMASLSRLAGGRPLDEAIVNDGVFRVQSYNQMDLQKRNALGEAVKASSIMGNQPDETQILQFASKYAASGGNQAQFNKWILNQMKAADTNQATKITQQLNSPFGKKVQLLMGGDEGTY